jgi:hypothetical protein
MRSTFAAALIAFAAALIALFLLPVATMAQTAPTQTAAVDSAAATPAAPAATSPAGGITRDQFIQRAKDRAGQRAASRFDQMDANHDGILERDEVRAWRTEHPRRGAAQPGQSTAQ